MKLGPCLTAEDVHEAACATLLPPNSTDMQKDNLKDQITKIICRDVGQSSWESAERFFGEYIEKLMEWDAVREDEEDCTTVVVNKRRVIMRNNNISYLQNVPYWRIGADSDDEYGDELYRNMLCNNEYFHRNLEGPVFKDCITTIPVAFLAWMELLIEGRIDDLVKGVEAKQRTWSQPELNDRMDAINARPKCPHLVPYELHLSQVDTTKTRTTPHLAA
ncbi:hypothetical protein ACKKBG_A04925 [Auxenochlorella protothecoides x Auxenochlorella symbiontica]